MQYILIDYMERKIYLRLILNLSIFLISLVLLGIFSNKYPKLESTLLSHPELMS